MTNSFFGVQEVNAVTSGRSFTHPFGKLVRKRVFLAAQKRVRDARKNKARGTKKSVRVKNVISGRSRPKWAFCSGASSGAGVKLQLLNASSLKTHFQGFVLGRRDRRFDIAIDIASPYTKRQGIMPNDSETLRGTRKRTCHCRRGHVKCYVK